MSNQRTMRWYMDEAKKNLGIKSDRKLAIELKMASISRWCDPYKPVVPEANVMLKLAKMANVPDHIVLLDRDIIEAQQKFPETVPVYKKNPATIPQICGCNINWIFTIFS